MTPYFDGHPFARALFGLTLVIWVVSEVRQVARVRPEATRRDRGSRLVIALLFGAGLVLAALARTKVASAAFAGNVATFGLGLAIMWAGIGLRWWSIGTLGRYFTINVMTSADQPVITDGPYRLLRHPSYAGLLLIFAGIGVVYANWLSLAALIVFPLLALVNRIRVEEAALSTTLGEAYRSYASSRKRIIPFVW